MKKLRALIIAIILLSPVSCFAVLPVIDPAAIVDLVRQLTELKKQYDVMQQTYETTQNELNQTKELTNDAEGHYGYGNILNNQTNMNNRAWSPNDWQSTLQGLSGQNPARYQQLLTQYKNNNPALSQQNYEKGESASNYAVYQNEIANNQAATVTATYAFNEINKELSHINQLSQQIETTQDEKAATDLGTRMQAEIAYVQVQMLKQMALMNEQMASNSANDIQYETTAAKFNQLPDE